jgi:hypothetical protein
MTGHYSPMKVHPLWKGEFEMRHIARFCPSLAILLLMAAPAFAQNEYRFEVFGAGSFPRSKNFEIGLPQFSPPIKGAHHYSNGVRAGVRFGVDFGKHWGEDIIYSYGPHATKIQNLTGGTQFPFTVQAHEFAFNALWYPVGFDAKKKVFPYLTTGVGGTFYVITQKTINEGLEAGMGQLRTENVLTFNAGGGVRLRVAKHAGVRVEMRDRMSRTPRFGMPKTSSDPAALVFPTTGVFHTLEFSFAFVYQF